MERRFVVYTEPHHRDPSWVSPVIEIQANPASGKWEIQKPMTDATELAAVVKEITDRQVFAAAFNQGAANVMQLFGITPEDYYTKLKEEKGNAKQIAPEVPAAPSSGDADPTSVPSTIVGTEEKQ